MPKYNINLRSKNWERRQKILFILLLCCGMGTACKKEIEGPGGPTPLPRQETPFDISTIRDTYADIAPFENHRQWGPYNTHDPGVIKEGEYFYSYSTDAAFGTAVRPGIQIRRSKDLIKWDFVGWAFSGIPQMGAQFIQDRGGQPFQSLWAPHVVKVGSEFRLYYSLSSPVGRLSVICLGTSTSPQGPFVEKGLAVTSIPSGPGTNAIDPSVIVTPSGEHWMHYGSSWDGLFVLKLNPATGLALTPGDKGKRIVRRGRTNNINNGNLEAPEIIYHPELNKYFLFVAYDWLETKYNVRVFRSDRPCGPFLDWNGVDADNLADNGPMILSPYQFLNHGGWQGVSHPAVFKNDDGQYFIAHQGRPGGPGNMKYFMVLHIRKIFWSPEGWPMVSPQRYAAVEQTPVTAAEIAGDYEQIVLTQPVVPGYADEQTVPDFSVAFTTTLNANGRINGDEKNSWTYMAPWLELRWDNGRFVDKLHVSRGRDWENIVSSTLLMTGFNGDGTTIWLKKKK